MRATAQIRLTSSWITAFGEGARAAELVHRKVGLQNEVPPTPYEGRREKAAA